MTKSDFSEKEGESRSILAKMRKDEPVNLDGIIKIDDALNSLSILPEEKKA